MYRFATPPAAVLALAGTLLAGCSYTSIRAEREVQVTADHVADAPVHVESRNGRIEIVVASELDQVVVEATLRCSGRTIEEAEARVAASRIDVSRNTSRTLFVKPVFDGGPRSNDGASFVIRVPDATGVFAESGNGSLTIMGTSGDLIARTSNGRVSVTDHDGAVRARTSNGRIELRRVTGPVEGRTSNGRIVVELALDQSGPVHLDTSNGSVQLAVGPDFGGALSMSTSNGRVTVEDHADSVQTMSIARRSGQVEFAAEGANSTIDTSNGSITVSTQTHAGRE